ncbi:STM4014 family protein [Nocardia sp. NPDC057353]|uniref:STM4014 family protein n=1 Tax=Nocardia sp. NPDC057353 TaxID=3346104 RepID=UPI0036350D93
MGNGCGRAESGDGRAGSGGDPALRIAVVGVPANRRSALFAAAAARAGLPAPRLLSWRSVLAGTAAFEPGELVRLDSPGEDPELDLLLRGHTDSTRVEGTARWYRRFLAAARAVAERAAADGAELLDDPADLAVLFDKRRCHAVLRAAGVPVPASPTSGPDAAPVRGWADLRALLAEPGMRRAFVKLAHGSSASGVLAVETAGGGRVQALTSVQRDERGRLFNSLRLHRYRGEREVAAVIDALAPDGLHVERWLPKPALHGRSADLRVLVVAGRATHVVVRTGSSAITNLHLGGARGELAEVVAAAGEHWAGALAVAEAAAACFPGFSRVGVDLLPGLGWRRWAVGEVNAFGDLLPRLTGLPGSGAEGLDTYAAQLAAIGRRSPCPT